MTGQRSSSDLKAEVLAALSHPNRIRILEFIRKDVRCNCELAPALELEQSNLSRHLKILVQAGILLSWKEGLRVNFRVADDRIYRIIDLALAVAKHSVESRSEVFEEA
jgi:ArsR family transcriptional regulator